MSVHTRHSFYFIVLKKLFHNFFRPTVSFAILVAFGIFTAAIAVHLTKTNLAQKRLASLGTAPLGTEVFTDILSLKVESVREDPVGAVPFVPHQGNVFIIPTIVITNLSTTTRDLIPTLALYVKDDDGNIYNMAVAPLHTEQFGGPMLPHDTVRQEIAFEVKNNAKGLILYFESGGRVMTESLEY